MGQYVQNGLQASSILQCKTIDTASIDFRAASGLGAAMHMSSPLVLAVTVASIDQRKFD